MPSNYRIATATIALFFVYIRDNCTILANLDPFLRNNVASQRGY
jgi:hypothetical protein